MQSPSHVSLNPLGLGLYHYFQKIEASSAKPESSSSSGGPRIQTQVF